MANWLDKYEQGGLVLKKKTKDNYGKKENANAGYSTAGPGWVGEGTTNKGFNYNGAWGGTMQNGGFLQPNSSKLPEGYVIPYNTPSTELAMSIGGEKGEPAYLIPSFKGGKKLKDPIAEYKKTGEHLGGPFKTYQEADKFGEMRHEYVEKGQSLPSPLKWWGDMAMGGGIPGSVGFTYARTQNAAPSNGKYAKKTKASAQNGTEMKFYQEGLDFKPKSISKNGSVIKDDRGQWAYPGEITEIGSNDITMQGVDYPVLGISDTGDTQMMYPDQDYKFDGEKVTEYPMAQNGRTLPEVTVTSKADPRFKAYQDSLALYNASIDMGKKSAKALAKDYYKQDVEYTKMAKDYDENREQHNKFVKSRYKSNLDFYNKILVDPITKGTKPKFGGLYKYDKDAADRIVIEEDILNKGIDNYTADNDRIEKGYYKQTLESYKGFKKLNKNIKPVKYLKNAELFPIPVYKKPVQPVKYQKPEPAPVVTKQSAPEKPTPQPKPLYEYEGESVMAQTPGGGGAAMVGVKKKDGTIEYIRPEDYQRMGVPKYGQDYIKSKQKMQDGGWLDKYK